MPAMPTTQGTNEFPSPLTHTHERLVLWRFIIIIIIIWARSNMCHITCTFVVIFLLQTRHSNCSWMLRSRIIIIINNIINNKSPKDESFVSVSEGRRKFVRPLGGRHSREAFVRARFRRMRIVRHRVRITGKAGKRKLSLH